MNDERIKKLRKLIDEHVDAQVQLSWKGAQMAGDAAQLELNAIKARNTLDEFLRLASVEVS